EWCVERGGETEASDACVCCSCFFFFQAEDGIRDWSVTGVQTCALPISLDCRARYGGGERDSPAQEQQHRPDGGEQPAGHERTQRSEERRVGKEGRSRGGPEQ